VDCREHEMRSRDKIVASLSAHFKIQPHRLHTKACNPNTYFQNVVELRNAMKVTLEMHARQPDMQLIKHHSVVQPDGAKQLRLGIFKEVNISAVKDNAR